MPERIRLEGQRRDQVGGSITGKDLLLGQGPAADDGRACESETSTPERSPCPRTGRGRAPESRNAKAGTPEDRAGSRSAKSGGPETGTPERTGGQDPRGVSQETRCTVGGPCNRQRRA